MLLKRSYKRFVWYNWGELPAYWLNTARAKWRLRKKWAIKSLSYGKNVRQYALVVAAPDLPSTAPWAVYCHGGAWTFGTPEQFLPAARLFVEAGYRVVMPSHRRLPGRGFGGLWSDLNALFDRLGDNPAFQQPPTIVSGMSAGGHLAASMGWRPDWWKEKGWNHGPEKLLLCGAVVNLDAMNNPGLVLLRGRPGHPDYLAADPTRLLRNSDPLPARHLVVHGTADAMAPPHQMACTCEVLKKKNTRLDTIWLADGTHLDSCRWMYREDKVAQAIRQFIAE